MADKIYLKSLKLLNADEAINPVQTDETLDAYVYNDLENNKALGPYSNAFGSNTRAGVYGYRLKEVRNNDGKTAEIIVDDADCEDKARDKYSVNDTLCFDGKSHFYTELTIAENGLNSISIDGKTYSVIKVNISELAVKPTTGVQVDTNDDGSYNTDEKENWVWVAGKSFGIPMLRSQGAFVSGVADIEKGESTIAVGFGANATGRNTKAIGDYAHTEGRNTIANYAGHAEGVDTKALNQYAHAEGYKTQALAIASHAEGANTIVTGQRAHAEGTSTQAKGNNSHAEGSYTISEGSNSHSEGGSLNENTPTVAKGDYSHAEGQGTQAIGLATHSEGRNSIAKGNYSHAEGRDNQANGANSHVEGNTCQTGPNADNAHAEGHGTKALGVASHSEGWGTQAYCDYQHAQGRWNIIDTKNRYAHIVGNGNVDRTDPSNPITTRSNAHTLDWDGNAWFAGTITATDIDGTEFNLINKIKELEAEIILLKNK